MLAEKIQLEADEKILIQVRKHWFVIGMQMLAVVIVALFPLAVYSLVTRAVGAETALPEAGSVLVALYSAWLLISWMALGSVWTNYYLDVWTITNKRLITVDQRGLFNRKTGSFRLERLQDINVTIRGMIATFLDYGNVEAETASGDSDFVARNVPSPQELKALILSATDATTYNEKPGNGMGTEV